MISFDDFKKLEIKIAVIKEAENHPDADKLYVLKVDTGTEIRQLVAGIKTSYSIEDLIGRQIVLLCNIEPAKIRGVESQGMLLAASDDGAMSILSPDKQVKLGSVVR